MDYLIVYFAGIMFKFLIFFAFACAPTFGRANLQINPLVVAGVESSKGYFPFAVSLRTKAHGFHCGGSIISERYVVTAAHCVMPNNPDLNDPKKQLVGVGSVHLSEQTLHEIEEIVTHEEFKPPVGPNDLALLRLKEPLTFSDNVQPIKFPYLKDVSGKEVTAMGWGATGNNKPHSPVLMHLNKTVLSVEDCRKRMPTLENFIGERDICLASTKEYGMCFGDSGSPMLYVEDGTNYLVGVMAWGIPCAQGYPDVHMRVSFYNDWIRKNMH